MPFELLDSSPERVYLPVEVRETRVYFLCRCKRSGAVERQPVGIKPQESKREVTLGVLSGLALLDSVPRVASNPSSLSSVLDAESACQSRGLDPLPDLFWCRHALIVSVTSSHI